MKIRWKVITDVEFNRRLKQGGRYFYVHDPIYDQPRPAVLEVSYANNEWEEVPYGGDVWEDP